MPYDVYHRLGLSGKGDHTGKGGAEEVYRVVFDTIVTDFTLVALLPEIPQMFDAHPFDALSVVSEVNCEQSEEDPTVWDATVTYSRISSDPAQAQEPNPLLRPAKVRWSSVRVQLPFICDTNGRIVNNSVGDLYNPQPMYDLFRDLATITWNIPYIPSWLRSLKGRINSTPFVLEGQYCLEECGRINDIEISEFQVENNVRFKSATLQLEMGHPVTVPKVSYIAEDGILTVKQNVTVGCFKHIEQDAGYRQKVSGKVVKIVDDAGLELAQPALLDGLGGKLTTPISPGDEVYRLFDKPPGTADFSILNLPSVEL